jgi:hypothetical protein
MAECAGCLKKVPDENPRCGVCSKAFCYECCLIKESTWKGYRSQGKIYKCHECKKRKDSLTTEDRPASALETGDQACTCSNCPATRLLTAMRAAMEEMMSKMDRMEQKLEKLGENCAMSSGKVPGPSRRHDTPPILKGLNAELNSLNPAVMKAGFLNNIQPMSYRDMVATGAQSSIEGPKRGWDATDKDVDVNADGFVRPARHLRDERRKQRRPMNAGKSTDTNTELATVQRLPRIKYKAMFVTGFLPSVTADAITAHLRGKVDVPELRVLRLKTRHQSYNSFHVSVEESAFSKINSPDIWPTECLFSEFFGRLFVDLLHPDEKERAGVPTRQRSQNPSDQLS